MAILRATERSMVRAMCGVQLKDRKRSTDLMFILGLKEAIDQLAMANSARWYGHVLRKALDFEVEGQRKKGRPKWTWKKACCGRKCDGWLGKERYILPFKVECWCKQDGCWLGVILAPLTYWGHCQIYNIGVYHVECNPTSVRTKSMIKSYRHTGHAGKGEFVAVIHSHVNPAPGDYQFSALHVAVWSVERIGARSPDVRLRSAVSSVDCLAGDLARSGELTVLRSSADRLLSTLSAVGAGVQDACRVSCVQCGLFGGRSCEVG